MGKDDGPLAELVGALVLALGLGVWWMVRHPRCTLLAGTLLGSLIWLDPVTAGLLWLLVVLVLVVWWQNHPTSFHLVVVAPVRSAWRRWWVYARRWPAAMDLTGLSKHREGDPVRPRLGRVQTGLVTDLVDVRMRAGQSLGDWEDHAEELANTFGAESCRIRPRRSGALTLEFRTRDTLTTTVAPFPHTDVVDLSRIPVGVTELGQRFCLRLIGRHTLIAGSSDSGKSSGISSLLWGIAPAIPQRLVEVWMCDPKEGVEGSLYRPMLSRFEYETPGMLDLLQAAVEFKVARGHSLRADQSRQHVPTVDDPLLLLILDEMAALTHVLGDRKQRDEFDRLIRLLAQQGRALGVSLVGAVQDPAKDGLPFRNLFTTRIALRLMERTEPDMVLGEGARNRGAVCDRIPETLPGVGYVRIDGRREPTRFRFCHHTDAQLIAMAQTYAVNPHPEAIPADVIELHPQDDEVPA